jgi:hypothetical protein
MGTPLVDGGSYLAPKDQRRQNRNSFCQVDPVAANPVLRPNSPALIRRDRGQFEQPRERLHRVGRRAADTE